MDSPEMIAGVGAIPNPAAAARVIAILRAVRQAVPSSDPAVLAAGALVVLSLEAVMVPSRED
jgi:hypothetical protein